MEEVVRQIETYHKWSMGCLMGTVFCVIAAFILYKKLNIREVIRFFKRHTKRMTMFALIGISMVGVWVLPVEAEKAEQEENDLPPEILEFQVMPGSAQQGDEFKTEDHLLYYVKNSKEFPDINICIKLWDEQEAFNAQSVCLEYRIEGSEQWQLLTEEVEWTNPEDGQFVAVYPFDGIEEVTAVYEFRCRYMDISGQTVDRNLPEKYVLDKIAPSFEPLFTSNEKEVISLGEDGKQLEPYYNAADEIRWSFQIFEKNLDMEKSFVQVTMKDRNGQVIKEHPILWNEDGFQTTFTEDGHYQAKVILTDLSGNQTVDEKSFAIDYRAPEEAVITYRLENGKFLSRIINKLTFGYFAKEKVIALIQVEDRVSGVDKISYTYTDVDDATNFTKSIEPEEVETNKNLYQAEVELPHSFKGSLKVYSVDKMGNGSEEFQDVGIISESEETHLQTSKASIEIPANGLKQREYFNTDVPVNFFVKDSYSGIQSISYVAGEELKENISLEEDAEIVTEQVEKNYVISAAANEGNHIALALTFTDNAGHTTTLSEEELPMVHIDITKPKIQIVYDNNEAENGKYYKSERMATVFVTEKNFDPEDVDFLIEGGEAEIGDWHCNALEELWYCHVRFYKDGEYRFGFSCTDLAGNTESYGKIDEFVIDQTSPIISVEYDNEEVKNQLYYKAPRIATLTIREKNFLEEDVEILLTADDEHLPAISPWKTVGDNHQAKVLFNYDGEFSLGISYTDMAGNEAAAYGQDHFIVDLTKPEIQISEVKDQSANQGVVSPLIQVMDKNFLENSTWIELLGVNNGKLEVKKNQVELIQGEVIRIEDITHDHRYDDLYHLSVGAEDMAGNTALASLTFSVNRYGSVYTLDLTTEQLAGEKGAYYTTKEIPLTITETNVDTLIYHEIVCSCNGKLKTLQPHTDYTIREKGDATSWKQYEYQIGAHNFAQDGHYRITIYSKDRAGNLSDNQSRGKNIAFAVDKTPPSILISGVEMDGRYRENSREVMVYVEDNLFIKEATVYLDEFGYVFDSEKIQETDGKLSLSIPGKNTWQTIRVESIDMAGNENETGTVKFLITPNMWVQFYNQKALFYSTLVGAAILCFIGGVGILRKQ